MLLLFLSLDNEGVLIRGKVLEGLFASGLSFGGEVSIIFRLPLCECLLGIS